MRLLILCLFAHAWLALAVPSPWWTPDLTMVGLVLSVSRRPERWLPLSLLAGLFAMAWAVRLAGPVFLSCLAVGAGVRLWTRHWDADDPRVELLLVGAACLLMLAGSFWFGGVWSFRLAGWGLVQTAVTCAALPLVRAMAGAAEGRRT